MQDTNERLNLLSQHPRDRAHDDLDFNSYARSIAKILAGLRPQHNGLTVGIFGDWGSGKSTLLKMVVEQLQDHDQQRPHRRVGLFKWLYRRIIQSQWRVAQERTQAQKQHAARLYRAFSGYRPIVIEFDAWRYEKREEMWVAFLRTILHGLEGHLTFPQTLKMNFRRWWARINRRELVKQVISWFWRALLIEAALYVFLVVIMGYLVPQLDWQKRMEELHVISWQAVVVLIILQSLGKVARAIRLAFTSKIDLPPQVLRAPLDKSQPIVVDQFRDDFAAIVNSVGSIQPIVVLIDDLDRAPVDQVTPLLEAIKHLGVKPSSDLSIFYAPIAFVLAADRRMVERAVATHYKDYWSQIPADERRYAQEYIEKIVQVSFELPPLSPDQLRRVLHEQNNIAPSPLSEARQQTIQVFAQGPKQNPREVIQAYNTFQSIWQVLQDRGIANPQLAQPLAALILIRYIWPNVFEQFARYPELFFDLHALATKVPNHICFSAEIEELLSLGCPAEEPLAMIDEIRQKNPDLLRLLGAVDLPANLNENDLVGLLALGSKKQPSARERNVIEVGHSLMSGDPSLIKFAARSEEQQVKQERLPWLMEFLEYSVLDTGDKKPSEEAKASRDMINALFALGRLRDVRAVEPISNLIQQRKTLSRLTILRAIYALANLTPDDNSQQSESVRRTIGSIVAELLLDEALDIGLRLRILRLFDATTCTQPELRSPIVRLALCGEMELIREMALKHAITAVQRVPTDVQPEPDNDLWLIEALNVLNAISPTAPTYYGYFTILAEFTGKKFPPAIATFTVAIAIDPSTEKVDLQKRAFDILANFNQPETAAEYMATVATTTSDSGIRERAMKKVTERQNEPQSRWYDDVWKNIETAVKDNSAEGWESLMVALGDVSTYIEAILFLKAGLDSDYVEVRNAARRVLRNVALTATAAVAEAANIALSK
jgi:Cdc6-like AAA superfamily ATPase